MLYVFGVFGIKNGTINLVVDLLILFLFVVWMALLYWTYADARRRIADPMLVGCATAASLFPFVGTIVYMILRPPEYLEDVRERDLDLQAAEARLHELDHSLCPHCDYPVERDFVRCPSCLRKLKERCQSCSKPLDRAWTICPYCEAEVATAKPSRATRREREAATGRSSEPPSRSHRQSVELDVDSIEIERPARRRSGASAVRAPDATSLLTEATAPDSGTTAGGEPGPVDAEQNGTPESHADPARRRRSRPRAGD